jgi:succinate-semialdehyde dehydrogenase/glutarate-semialdehyde dehydrogenase
MKRNDFRSDRDRYAASLAPPGNPFSTAPMPFVSINPATEERLATRRAHSQRELQSRLGRAQTAFRGWRETSFAERSRALRLVANALRRRESELARLITAEMGKPLAQARAEVAKSAAACAYFADRGPAMLAPTRPADRPKAEIVFEPLGPVLAIMPWNFPLWQTIRAAAPALMAGNTILLKPAPSTAGCGEAIESVFRSANLPPDLLLVLLAETEAVPALIADPRIAAVTLTGSTRAGRAVAALAGQHLKPGVFELGGSDAYVVLADADLDLAAKLCAESRLINSGQSCVAAKRFIVDRRVRVEFEQRFVAHFTAARVGDPTDPATTVGPLARADLRDQLHAQVKRSRRRGARALVGGEPWGNRGYFYAPTVLTRVERGMPAFDEEMFGPVAAVISARDEDDAVSLANDSIYGLGAAVFSRQARRARRVAARLEAGCVALNDFVRSDPALPFGGVKQSGYGRELGEWGARSFVNVKTVVG